MAWSMPPSGPWNPGMMPPDMSMASYSQDQWTVMQQQNWQQWAQWQQQYAQWQNQYGDKYAEQMQAFQNMGGMPPLPPPSSAPPPAPPAPPPDQPPPPPHENNKPLYDNLPSQPAPVPPPNNRNTKSNNSNTQGNANWSYGTDTAPQANSSVNSEALKKLAEEERLFDIQFQKWEEEIEKWRKENVNHPDKQAYREYEEKFEACRAQLLERRQQMKLKRAKLTGAPVPPTGEKPTVPSGVPPPMNSMGNNSNMPSQNYSNMSQNSNNQYQQFHAPPTQYHNRSNNKNVDPQDRYESYDEDYSSQNTNMANFSHPDNATFLPTSGSGKGIPGLDLAPDSDHSKKQEVVDITDDAGDSQIGPDYSTISKGINNILGDQTIMNILSMVRQGGEDGNPKAGPNNSGNYFQDGMRQGGNMNRNNPQFGGNNQNNSQYGRNNQSGSQMGNNQVGPQFGGNNHNNSNFGSNNRNVPPLGGFNQNNSQFGGNTPQYERNNPQYERNNPQFGGNNKQFGANNQQFGGDNQQFGGNNQQFGGNNQQVGRPNQNKQQFGGNNQGNNPNGGNNLYNQQSGPQGQGNRNQNFYAGQNDNRQNMPFSRQRNNNSGPQNMGMNKFPSGEQYGDDMNRQYEDQSYENGPPSLLGRPSGPPSLLGRPNGPKPLMQDMSRGPPERRPLADANVNPVASQPARPKWMEDPLFTPSVIVEYEHKPLRLKAREFIEPVHMFDYNHKSKDEDKKADFEKEVEELFSRKPRRSEPDHANRPSRDYPRERDFERRPPRDEIEERRRPDIRDRFDTRGHDFRERDRAAPRGIEHRDRERDRDRADFRDRFEPRGPDYRDVRDRDARNSDHRDRPERRDDRDKYVRRDEIFSRDRERDRDRGRDSRRDESRQRSRSRDREPLKRALSKDTEVTNNAKKPKESVIPEKARHVVMIDDLLESPGREMRPAKIVIILRGPPGSGKSYLAKLIRDKEAEHGGTVRIMSIDDYFMQEGEVEEKDPATGKMVKKPTLKYEYDAKSETTYFNSLKRAFRRSLLDGYFSFLIFDAVNDELKSYADIWNYARQNGFQVYVCTMETDPQVCFKRNVHGRTLDDIQVICTRFFPTPSHHIQLDPTTLLQSAGITEVHMEDVEDEVVMEEAPQTEVETSFTSKWEKMDDAAQLARLDGTNKPLRPSQLSMEDYLQLDEWKPNTAKPGKKAVRWADLEERREQEKMRAIGFVVGQTDWNRMTDPTRGSSALTQTKYIERVRRF